MNTERTGFPASRAEIWRQLATSMGASFARGNSWKGDRVDVAHGNWKLILDTQSVGMSKQPILHTRLRAPFLNSGSFRFTIYRRTILSDVAKWFGMQDVEIGHPEFDRDFIVKTTDPARVTSLLSDAKIRQAIAAQPDVQLSLRAAEVDLGTKIPQNLDVLHSHSAGEIRSEERLKQLFDLFADTLDRLSAMGIASPPEPGQSGAL